MRSLDNGTVKEFHELLLRVAKEEAEKRGVTFEFDRTIVSEAGHVNVELSDRLIKDSFWCWTRYSCTESRGYSVRDDFCCEPKWFA